MLGKRESLYNAQRLSHQAQHSEPVGEVWRPVGQDFLRCEQPADGGLQAPQETIITEAATSSHPSPPGYSLLKFNLCSLENRDKISGEKVLVVSRNKVKFLGRQDDFVEKEESFRVAVDRVSLLVIIGLYNA